jgi:hypothetical protein
VLSWPDFAPVPPVLAINPLLSPSVDLVTVRGMDSGRTPPMLSPVLP